MEIDQISAYDRTASIVVTASVLETPAAGVSAVIFYLRARRMVRDVLMAHYQPRFSPFRYYFFLLLQILLLLLPLLPLLLFISKYTYIKVLGC